MPTVYDECTKQISYESPEEEIIKKKSNSLIDQLIKYAKAHNLSSEDFNLQRILIPRIILRVDKRESYFLIFHEQTRINEIKQAALTSYWILKFKPIMVTTNNPALSYKHNRINEGFAAFYLFSALKQYAIENGCPVKKMSDRLVDELMYAFTYWDLSKESLILIAETIGEAFFGIEAQGMNCNGSDE